MKEAFIFLATGFEEIEALGTADILRRGGVRTTTVSIDGNMRVRLQYGGCLDPSGGNTGK